MKRPVILLVNPWIHDFAAYDLWARPMGLLVLATRLRSDGWEPILVDCLDPDHPSMPPAKVKAHFRGSFHRTPIAKPEALRDIPRTYSRYGVHLELIEKDLRTLPEPRAILATSHMTYWYPGVIETIRVLKDAFPRVPVFLGGIYATLLPDHARRFSGADEVLPGPGEETLGEALFRRTGQAPSSGMTGPKPEFAPALDLLRAVRFLPLLTSRGCPLRCSYCASGKIGPLYMKRPVREVLVGLESAVRTFGVRDVALYDDAFLVDAPGHALPLLERAAERIPDLRWHSPNGLHASWIDARVAGAMKRTGFETIRLGLERSSDGFHAKTGGKTDAKSFVSAVAHLRDAGFLRRQIGVYLLVGLPGQSGPSIEADVTAVLDAGAFPRLAEYSPIPGTAMWSEAVSRGRYSLADEPLYHNCTLLPAAEPGVDWAFLRRLRSEIAECVARDCGAEFSPEKPD